MENNTALLNKEEEQQQNLEDVRNTLALAAESQNGTNEIKHKNTIDYWVEKGKVVYNKDAYVNISDWQARLISVLGNPEKNKVTMAKGETFHISNTYGIQDGLDFKILEVGNSLIPGFNGAVVQCTTEKSEYYNKVILWADGSKGFGNALPIHFTTDWGNFLNLNFIKDDIEILNDWVVNDGTIAIQKIFPELTKLVEFAQGYEKTAKDGEHIDIGLGQSMMGIGMSVLAHIDGFQDIEFKSYSGCANKKLLDKAEAKWGFNDKKGGNLEVYVTSGEPLTTIYQPFLGDNTTFYVKENTYVGGTKRHGAEAYFAQYGASDKYYNVIFNPENFLMWKNTGEKVFAKLPDGKIGLCIIEADNKNQAFVLNDKLSDLVGDFLDVTPELIKQDFRFGIRIGDSIFYVERTDFLKDLEKLHGYDLFYDESGSGSSSGSGSTGEGGGIGDGNEGGGSGSSGEGGSGSGGESFPNSGINFNSEIAKENEWIKDRLSEDGGKILLKEDDKIKLPKDPEEPGDGTGSHNPPPVKPNDKPNYPPSFDDGNKNTNKGDPILVDLNGDGIKTTTLENGVYFDHEGDGFAETSAWVDKNDGILIIDKNNNGKLDNGNEIFGDNYVKSNGKKATSGFDALRDLDSNNDGIISAEDSEFNNIKILKGNGTLLTLEEAGIVSINLNSTAKNTVDENGNTLISQGTFVYADGTTGALGDFNLAVDKMNSFATEWVEVSEDVELLPDVKGFGMVRSLHQAIMRDGSGVLKGLVEEFIAAESEADKKEILGQILYKWTGANKVTVASGGDDSIVGLNKVYDISYYLNGNNNQRVA